MPCALRLPVLFSRDGNRQSRSEVSEVSEGAPLVKRQLEGRYPAAASPASPSPEMEVHNRDTLQGDDMVSATYLGVAAVGLSICSVRFASSFQPVLPLGSSCSGHSRREPTRALLCNDFKFGGTVHRLPRARAVRAAVGQRRGVEKMQQQSLGRACAVGVATAMAGTRFPDFLVVW